MNLGLRKFSTANWTTSLARFDDLINARFTKYMLAVQGDTRFIAPPADATNLFLVFLN